jgi:hypothetical protein
MDNSDSNKIMPIESTAPKTEKQAVVVEKTRTIHRRKRCVNGKRRNKRTRRCRKK